MLFRTFTWTRAWTVLYIVYIDNETSSCLQGLKLFNLILNALDISTNTVGLNINNVPCLVNGTWTSTCLENRTGELFTYLDSDKLHSTVINEVTYLVLLHVWLACMGVFTQEQIYVYGRTISDA